jgi:hypothetical protein
LAAATLGQQYAADLHRVVERGAEDAHLRRLLHRSAAIVITRMQKLTRDLWRRGATEQSRNYSPTTRKAAIG